MKMKTIRLFLISLVYFYLCCNLCLASDQTVGKEDEETVDLEQIVVTATKSEESTLDVPASISVVEKDELDQSPNFTIDEAFRQAPTVQVIRGEGMGTTHNFINIRGIGTKRNLLYLDGINMVESMSGNTTLSLLPTDDIEKIEILRGPSSALYGGKGMSGVINIFSAFPEEGAGGSLKTSFGEYNYQKHTAKATYGSDKWGMSMDATRSSTDNYWTRDTIINRSYNYKTGSYSYDYDSEYEHKDHVGWKNWNRDYEENAIRPKFFFTPSDETNIIISSGYLKNETGNGYTDRYKTANGDVVEKNLEKEKSYIGMSGKTRLSDKSSVSYRMSYHRHETANNSENMDLTISLDDPAQLAPGGKAPQFYRSTSEQGSKDFECEVSYSHLLESNTFGSHNLTFGGQVQSNNVYWTIVNSETGKALTNAVDTTVNGYSAYIQDEYFINDKVTLTSGLRGDVFEKFDGQISPKLALQYRPDSSVQYYISSGYAYNPPAYSQKFGTDWNMTAYTVRTNNENLDAEKLWSTEIGAKKRFTDQLSGGISAYYAIAKDLIESIKEKRKIGGAANVNITYEYHDNIDKAIMMGIESELSYDFNAHNHLRASFSMMDARNDETDRKLPEIPEIMGSISYRYNRDFFAFGHTHEFWSTVRARGQNGFLIEEYSVDDPQKVAGFITMDISMGIDLSNHVKLFAEVGNIFDVSYREFTYTRYQPGRCAMIGAEIHF